MGFLLIFACVWRFVLGWFFFVSSPVSLLDIFEIQSKEACGLRVSLFSLRHLKLIKTYENLK